MRGADIFNMSLFTLSHLEDFISADHPLRSIEYSEQRPADGVVRLEVRPQAS